MKQTDLEKAQDVHNSLCEKFQKELLKLLENPECLANDIVKVNEKSNNNVVENILGKEAVALAYQCVNSGNLMPYLDKKKEAETDS